MLAENKLAEIAPVDCRAELDTIVAGISNDADNPSLADKQLQSLADVCNNMPQIAHNRGVLAARADRWPEAIAHFEQSLAADHRAAMTHQHIKSIFEYRAAKAYAQVLSASADVAKPSFELQDSTSLNADSLLEHQQRSQFHTISTVEYELYAWWQAHQRQQELAEHYVDNYPAAAISNAQQKYLNKRWADMQREITFTARDAVVVISDELQKRTLLLMRLVGSRWKIYQESVL